MRRISLEMNCSWVPCLRLNMYRTVYKYNVVALYPVCSVHGVRISH